MPEGGNHPNGNAYGEHRRPDFQATLVEGESPPLERWGSSPLLKREVKKMKLPVVFVFQFPKHRRLFSLEKSQIALIAVVSSRLSSLSLRLNGPESRFSLLRWYRTGSCRPAASRAGHQRIGSRPARGNSNYSKLPQREIPARSCRRQTS